MSDVVDVASPKRQMFSEPSNQEPLTEIPPMEKEFKVRFYPFFLISDHSNIATKIEPRYFKKYESPLKSFRSFRFSPFYKESVPGGYKSLTYSNTITQKKNTVCTNEIFQGVCKDTKCSNLHFSQITPTGMILHSHDLFPFIFLRLIDC